MWNRKINFILGISLFALILLIYNVIKPKSIGYRVPSNPVLSEPIQINLEGNEYIKIKKHAVNISLRKRAKYKISAKVAVKYRYADKYFSKIAPLDLALIWGKVADKQYKKYIKFSQSLRFAFYKYSFDCPLPKDYISTHFSNNHIIPANGNIKKALIMLVKKNKQIYLEGYLVDINGIIKKRTFSAATSLKRDDNWGGACEIFYVTKVIVNDKIYV